jgi:AcrR family transcriptional regulator
MRASDDNRGRGGQQAEGEMNPCDTRRAIMEAARTRFLHYGYKKTTIDEIATDAGVGKGTVYLYFGSKEDIMLTIARGVKRNITAQMQALAHSLAAPEEKLRRMVIAAILSVHDAVNTTAHGVELVDEMLRPKLMQCGQEEREAQLEMLAEVISEGVRRGDFAVVDGDAQRAARHLMLATVSFYPPYMDPCHGRPTCRHDLETRVNGMLDFVFHGIRRRA